MKNNQLKSGVVLSFVNLAIGNLIPLIYTPIMLRMMGQAEYGLYGIAQSIMGYINLLNFGIGGTIVRYIAKYRAESNQDNERIVIGVFAKLYSCIAFLVLAVGTIISFNTDVLGRSLSAQEVDKLGILVRVMTINAAISLPLSVASSIIIAHERYIFHKAIGLGCTILTPVINLTLLFRGAGSIGLVFCSLIVNLLSNMVYVWYSAIRLKLLPKINGRIPGLLREILGFSAFVFLESIVDTLYWSTDKLIIGWAVGSIATAVYNIGATFNTYVTSLSTAVSSVLTPKLTIMAVKNVSKEEFTRIFIKVGRLQFIVISFIVSAFVAFGRQFIALWAGLEYGPAYYVALLTMIPVTIPLIQNTGINILYALNRHQFRSIVYAGIAVLNVVLTFWWVEDYGIIGAALATCVAYVIGNILIINWYYYKKIGIDIPLFWKNIAAMCPVMVLMGTVAWFVLDAMTIANWLVFFACAGVYTVIYLVLAYRFMMNQYERDTVMVPVRKVLRRLRIIR